MAVAMGALGSAVIGAGAGAAAGGAGLFSGLGTSLIGGGASLLGGFMRNTSSADQAFKQMAMQDYWLRNRHRIEIGDLEAAGLNPILSAGGQPPVPAGARAEMGDPITPAVGSALQAATVRAALDKNEAEVKLLNQQAGESLAREGSVKVDTELKRIPLDMALKGMNYAQRKVFWEDAIAESESGKRNYERLTAQQKVYVTHVAADVAQKYGDARARAELDELVQRAQYWTSSAFHAYQEGRSSKIDADLSEIGGGAFRGLERGVRAAQGASSAYRDYQLGQGLPRAGGRR